MTRNVPQPGGRRSPSSLGGLFQSKDGTVFVGHEYEKQVAINEAKANTKARACFRECLSCGTCKNSARDATYPKMFDANAGKSIDCRKCEPFRFHDCHNGLMRNAHGQAEPFTQGQLDLIKVAEDGRPLM